MDLNARIDVLRNKPVWMADAEVTGTTLEGWANSLASERTWSEHQCAVDRAKH